MEKPVTHSQFFKTCKKIATKFNGTLRQFYWVFQLQICCHQNFVEIETHTAIPFTQLVFAYCHAIIALLQFDNYILAVEYNNAVKH